MWMNRILPVALGLLVSAPAWAQSHNTYLDAGVRLYNDLEYEVALDQLKKAVGDSPAQDIQIALYRGMVRFELSLLAEAEMDFKVALALDQEAKLPGHVSPKMSALFEKSRAEIARSRPARPTPVLAAPAPTPIPVVIPKPTLPEAKVALVKPEPKPIDVPRTEPVAVRSVPTSLEPEAVAPIKIEPPKPTRSRGLSLGLLGGAADLGGGGAFLGLRSTQSVEDARSQQFQSDAVARRDTARSQALVANLAFGAAAILAVTGVVLLFGGGS